MLLDVPRAVWPISRAGAHRVVVVLVAAVLVVVVVDALVAVLVGPCSCVFVVVVAALARAV